MAAFALVEVDSVGATRIQFLAPVDTSAVLRDFVEDAIADPQNSAREAMTPFIARTDSADTYPDPFDPFDPFWTVIRDVGRLRRRGLHRSIASTLETNSSRSS